MASQRMLSHRIVVSEYGPPPTHTVCGLPLWLDKRIRNDILFSRFMELTTCEKCRVESVPSVPEHVQGSGNTETKE